MRRCSSFKRIRHWETDGLKYPKLSREGKLKEDVYLRNEYRTDNAIKNHFYSSLRKNISRISKDVVTLDQKLSP